jgi:hypothetical protein
MALWSDFFVFNGFDRFYNRNGFSFQPGVPFVNVRYRNRGVEGFVGYLSLIPKKGLYGTKLFSLL